MSNPAFSRQSCISTRQPLFVRIANFFRRKPKEELPLIRPHKGLVSVLEHVDREVFNVIRAEAERVEAEAQEHAHEPRDTVVAGSGPSLFQTVTSISQGGETVRFLNDLGTQGYGRQKSVTLASGARLASTGEYLSAAKGYITSLARRIVYEDQSIHSEEVVAINERLFENLRSCISEGDFEQAKKIMDFFFNSWYKVIIEQPERAGKAHLLLCSLNAPFLFSISASLQSAIINRKGNATDNELRETVESYLNALYVASYASMQDSVSKVFVTNSRSVAQNSQGHLVRLAETPDFKDFLSPVLESIRKLGLSYGTDTFSTEDIPARAENELSTIVLVQERLGLRNPFIRLNCEKEPTVRVGRA